MKKQSNNPYRGRMYMKLLVCDIEGTIFQPHIIKSSQHASYIWTAIAEALGKDAEREEINTQIKWRIGRYGKYDTGAAYAEWVNESIRIHRNHGLKKKLFDELIQNAPYVLGVQRFFSLLNRNEYIPVFISGGIQNLNQKACRDLNVDISNSYASCEYYFKNNGELDTDLTFLNTCNFYGKEELIQISLRKHNLGPTDWVFIGDGINDVSVTNSAPLSIGIDPIDELRQVADYSFKDFDELLMCTELLDTYNFLNHRENNKTGIVPDQEISINDMAKNRVKDQVCNLRLNSLEANAYNKYMQELGLFNNEQFKKRFFGIEDLLQDGELVLELLDNANAHIITSAVLQPFCSATETMIYVALALTGSSTTLKEIFDHENSLKKSIDKIENDNLKTVLHAYRKNRNSVSHSYSLMSMEAAHSMARHTYENIQRLELIINPFRS